MGRSYDDHSYRVRQEMPLNTSGALNGTSASAADVIRHRFMRPCTVQDWNGKAIVGGTDAGVISLLIGKSVAGTGAVGVIGTMALGTHAVDTCINASCAETNFDSGDELVVQRSAGTSTSVLQVEPVAMLVERFVNTDN